MQIAPSAPGHAAPGLRATVHRTARLSDGHDDHADLDLELDLGDADPPEDARLANPDTVPRPGVELTARRTLSAFVS